MWAGIKHALNSTLGTNDFKSLDKLQKEQLEEQIDLIKSQNEAMEDFIRYKNHELLYNEIKSRTPSTTPIANGTWVFPEYEIEVSPTTMSKYSGFSFNKVIFSNNLQLIQNVGGSWAGNSVSNIKQVILPPSLASITDDAFYGTSMNYIKLPKHISNMSPVSLRGINGLEQIDCEFSREYAINKLNYSDDTKWGTGASTSVFFANNGVK